MPRSATWIKALVSLGVVAALGGLLPWDAVVEAFSRVRPAFLLALVALFLAGHLLGVVKWRLLLSAFGLGLAPVLPGTVASLGTVLVLAATFGNPLSFADHHTVIREGYQDSWPDTGRLTSSLLLDPADGQWSDPSDLEQLQPLIDLSLDSRVGHQTVVPNETHMTTYEL